LIYDFGTLYAANGDSAIGNWFFKKDIGPCDDGKFGVVDSSLPGRPCLDPQPPGPLHSQGDALVISENTNGGTVTNISLYVWVAEDNSECGGAAYPTGTLVPPKNHLCLIGEFAGATCDSSGAQTVCGIMNQTDTEAPDDWGYQGKFPPPSDNPAPGDEDPSGTNGIGPEDFAAFSLLEAGINISQQLGDSSCFASFLKNTRTSASVRSQLKDFASGSFPLCGISVSNVCPANRVAVSGSQGYCSETDTMVCSADADCPALETCDIKNPQFLGGNTVRTQFAVTIDKKGPANLKNVQLSENTVDGCKVVAIDGKYTSISLTQNKYEDVLTDLTGPTVLTLECDSGLTPIVSNEVTVKAVTSFGGKVGPATGTMNDSSCVPAPKPGLNISKMCNGPVKLIDDNGTLKFKVPVKITLMNTGDEDLTNIAVTDDKIGSIGTFNLKKGAQTTATRTYNTTSPDGTATEWAGCGVFFSDIASVTAAEGVFTGALNSSQLPPNATATCPFCPDTCNRN
jgi:hypothetical protein